MGITDAIGKGIGLASMLGSQDKFIKKATEQLELSKAETSDKIDVKETRLAEVSQLQKVLSDIKVKASSLTDPFQAGFNRKTFITSTQDFDTSSEYITNIHVDDKALVGDTKIAVQQVATASELILSLANGVGFTKDTALGKDGLMTLTVGGKARIIDIVVGDKVEQITEKINHVFFASRDEFEAFLVEGDKNPDGLGTVFIEVRAKNTGVGTINVAYSNRGEGNALNGGNLHSQSNADGINAIAYINGIRREQPSNEFLNVVEGLSFDLSGRKNTNNVALANGIYGGLNYSTIKVKADNSNIKKMIVEFGNSLNQLSYIVAKNNQSTRSVNKDKYADPTTLMSSYDSSDSPLRGSFLMIEASEIWERFTTTKLGKEGDIQSIYELGMGLKKCHKDGVEYEEVYFEDESVFTKKFKDDFESICKFFITDVKITPTPGNLSTIQYLPGEFDKQIIDRAIVGKDILTETTFGLDGKVTRFIATVNGEVIIAHSIVHNEGTGRFNVSFEDPDKKQESILRGLEFSIDPKGAINKIERNTINYTPGLANLIQEDTRTMFSDDGMSGTTILEKDLIQEQIDESKKESEKIEKELKEFVARLESEYAAISQMDMMGALQMSMIEAALSGLNSST